MVLAGRGWRPWSAGAPLRLLLFSTPPAWSQTVHGTVPQAEAREQHKAQAALQVRLHELEARAKVR